jgi:hypothetical protein
VRNGRVKRSAFLAPRPPAGAAPLHPAGRARLLAPADGELICSPLVVVGELPNPAVRQRAGARAQLPELRMDGCMLVPLRHYAMIAGGHFAAALAIPWVTTGAHRLSLGPPSSSLLAVASGRRAGEAAAEDDAWDQRRVQIGRLGNVAADATVYANHEIPPAPATLSAVARLALTLSLRCHEPAPDLYVGGARHPVTTWLCGSHADCWMGVAVVDVETLAPGSYPLELRLRHHPPYRRRLERLSRRGGSW